MAERLIDITKWAPIVGRWEIVDANSPEYIGRDSSDGLPFGILASDARLSEGDAQTEICISSSQLADDRDCSGRILLGYRSTNNPYITVGLGGYSSAYVISQFDVSNGWRALALAGRQENLVGDRWYQVTVGLRGQRLTLTVDGVRVLEHTLDAPLQFAQLGLFAWGYHNIKFRGTRVSTQRGKIFVVMQFSGPYQELYTDVVRPLAQEFGLLAYHAGEVFGPGVILEDIVAGIVESKIVIAEITPPNQNVFYELGYAHALRKPTILLAERGKQLPFDISGYRCLFYENTIGGKQKVYDGLRKHLEAILNE